MLNHSGIWRHVCVAVILLLVFGGLSYADWTRPVWDDDFSDGNYTANETWTTFGSPGGSWDASSNQFVIGATYLAAPAGWAGAYVSVLETDQGIRGWCAPHTTAGNGVAAIAVLNYTPTAGSGFGTGYALSMTYNGSTNTVASIQEIYDAALPSEIGAEQTIVSGAHSALEFRFLKMDSRLWGRVWQAGTAEPSTWNWSELVPGTSYATGYGGVGVFTQNPGVTAPVATFDDIKYGTPEPTTMLLMATGIGALVLRRRRSS